jgi:hypothetical protein
LDIAFFYSEGFDETTYRRAYNQIDREHDQHHQSEIIINDNVPVVDLTFNDDQVRSNIDLTTNEDESRENDQNSGERLNEGNKSS